jgi:hypothetical protein
VTSKPPTDAGHPSEDQETEVSEPHSLWAELGLNEPEYLDESLAPEVDEPLLRSLIRQELPEKVARTVYRLGEEKVSGTFSKKVPDTFCSFLLSRFLAFCSVDRRDHKMLWLRPGPITRCAKMAT